MVSAYNNSTNELIRIGGYNISPDIYPWLKDHVFHNVSILPGSFILDLAYGISRELFFRNPLSIKNLNFFNPLILKNEGIMLNVSVSRINTYYRKFVFSDGAYPVSSDKPGNIYASAELNLQVDNEEISLHPTLTDFIKTASEIDVNSFYSNHFNNGNQYGKQFRNINKIWLKENCAAAKLKNTSLNSDKKINLIHPALLDSAIQLMSVLSKNNHNAFLLDSIRGIKIINKNLTERDLFCFAELISDREVLSHIEGNISILNSTGDICLQLSGVTIKYPEQVQQKSVQKKNIKLAANFTIDPIEDSFKFWNEYFSTPFSFEFAPYGQVFQQLLDPSSRFQKNAQGINIVLLNPEEWLNNGQFDSIPEAKGEAYLSVIKNKQVYLLPNNMKIVHINKYETDYLYQEIFRDKCYQKYDITINDKDTVIDIGANIGLFTLYANAQSRNVHILSYEPSPVVFDILRINTELYCSNTRIFNKGVSDKKKKAIFTYYPNSSVFSGFAADQTEDTETIRQVIQNILQDESDADDSVINNYINEITGDRLKKELYECELITVSDIIRDNNLNVVNLLKIDAEKSEINILNGIIEEDWQKIKQIVIEIHDTTGSRMTEAQEILTRKGFQIYVDEEKILRKSGLYNLYAKRPNEDSKTEIVSNDNSLRVKSFNQKIRQFSEALISFASQSESQIILGITPPSPELLSDETLKRKIKNTEQDLLKDLSKSSNIHVIPSDDFLTTFNIRTYYDNTGRDLGHIPYAPEMYASIGTLIFRKSFSLISATSKVIVLDCDNTLWKGFSGEDGYNGIQLTENYKWLQSFMIEQFNSGKLICLCSKNNQEDIDNVFEMRKDLILKKEHIISSRINWKSKSENLKSLISELNLNPDSFVFIDDNPLECAEVQSNCPEVKTLNLPANENDIPSFFKNTWLFDTSGITEEDKKRTDYYRNNILRNRYQESAISLKDFIESLKLNISTTEVNELQLSRAAQLTFRTNQFNFTTIRRNESEIKTLLSGKDYHCLITKVNDRFGDYGITGVLIYSSINNKIKVDTFLLSCRVLGKGVEYNILSELGKRALKENINEIEIKFIPSGKNNPAFDFITSLIPDKRNEGNDTISFTFKPEYLSEIKYEPDNKINELTLSTKKSTFDSTESSNGYFSSDHFQQIATELSDINSLMNKISKTVSKNNFGESKKIVLPLTNMEMMLSGIWKKILHIEEIGTNDNFFDCGGSSLKAIQLIAEIKKEMGKEISIIDLFEFPTINKLAEKFSESLNYDDNTKDDNKIIGEFSDKGFKKRRQFKRKRIE